jgi:alkaline phosphatase
MMYPKKCCSAVVLLIITVFMGGVLPAHAWDYPKPDPEQDVKDISFYRGPDDNNKITNIRASRPANVVLLIGDGMSFNHVALARHRAVGADGRLYMERMPVTGMVRTYSADRLVTDSAAAATALACGIKTNNGRIGTAPDGTPWISILEKANAKGFRTGLVATSSISHATPAGFAAHVESRDMQVEIAAQLLEQRVGILFGGGRKFWVPTPRGERKDNRNLIEEALGAGYQVVLNREQLSRLSDGPAVGLFADDGMTTFAPEPMLDEMTRVAIGLLSKKGDWFAPKPRFFVMIEGSQIDWAAHANATDNTIRQTLLFDLAVKEALEFAERDKTTLVIVTADHETGGLLIKADKREPVAEWHSTDHTGGDVPIFAYGPGSTFFSGTHDNTQIPKRIARLLGFDDFPAPMKAASEQTVK